MPGFFISNCAGEFKLKNPYAKHCLFEKMENENFAIQRNTLNKFMADKLFFEDEDVILIIEGIILNKKELCGTNDWADTVKKMMLLDERGYFDLFRGNFSGAHYNKKSDKWIVYSDVFGTKPVYYYNKNGVWIVASEVHYITDALKKLGVEYASDLNAAYDILSYGFMTSDATLVKEIKLLPYGCYMTIDENGIEVARYFDFEYCKGETDMSEDELIDKLDDLFKEAVRLEFEKDDEYGYEHIATLSGGLDSRMTIWTAADMKYPIFNVTFGQSDCMDEQVAKKVAKRLNAPLMVNTLDSGEMLLAWKPTVRMNAGQSLYSGISHNYLTFSKINLGEFGILHTGDVGDAIVGVFSYGNEGKYPGAFSSKLAHKATSVWDGVENVEKFKMRTRGFQGVGASKAVSENFIYCMSPFLYRDFFVFCLEKIPFSKRKGHYIYKQWVLKKHPEFAEVPLQRYNNGRMTEGPLKQMIRKIKRIGLGTCINWLLWKLHIRASVGTAIVKTSMNPFDEWYAKKEHIRNNLDEDFNEASNTLIKMGWIDEEFYADLRKLYTEGTTREKTQAITVVGALEQLFAD